MKEFGQWLGDLTQHLQKLEAKRHDDAYDVIEIFFEETGEYIRCTPDFADWAQYNATENEWRAPCRGCGREIPIECEPTEYEHDNNWGACSPQCCP